MDAHQPHETDLTEDPETRPDGLFRTTVDQSVGTIVAGFRAALTVLGCIALVVALMFAAAAFTNVDLATLGHSVVAIGLGWVATAVFWLLSTFLVTLLLFLCTTVKRLVTPTTSLVTPGTTPPASMFTRINTFSMKTSGIGGGIVCGQLSKENPLWHICGLVIFLAVFWTLALWMGSRSREPTTGLIRRRVPALICAAQVVGVIIGGLLYTLPSL